MPQDLPGVLAGIGAGQQVQHRQPDIVAQHDDEDDLQKGGELAGDHTLEAQVAEGRGDIEGQYGNDDLLHDIQHDVLKLGQQADEPLGLGPGCRQTDQHGQHQGTHDRHDLGDIQLEHHAGQVPQALHAGVNGQVGDQGVAGAHGHEGGADGGDIGDNDRHAQQPGGVGAQLGDGRGDEADNNEGHAEGDELAHDVLQGNDDLHDTVRNTGPGKDRNDKAADDSDGDAQKQAKGQAVA